MNNDIIKMLAEAGNQLRDVLQKNLISDRNKQKLVNASGLIQSVFVEILSGKDDTQRIDETAQKEGYVLLGDKKYIFKIIDNRHSVFVESADERKELSSSEEFSWGYRGGPSSRLAWAIITDCFADDQLTTAAQTELYPHIYQMIQNAPQGRSFELYEFQIRSAVR
jgi:hypothetical protein